MIYLIEPYHRLNPRGAIYFQLEGKDYFTVYDFGTIIYRDFRKYLKDTYFIDTKDVPSLVEDLKKYSGKIGRIKLWPRIARKLVKGISYPLRKCPGSSSIVRRDNSGLFSPYRKLYFINRDLHRNWREISNPNNTTRIRRVFGADPRDVKSRILEEYAGNLESLFLNGDGLLPGTGVQMAEYVINCINFFLTF